MAEMSVQRFINNDSVQSRINSLLDKRASQFTTSLLTAVNSNAKLAACKPETVLNAALTAASMDLPINQNLGFAALVPYGDQCQFQMQYKGYIQLAQRSGKYKTIAATPVFEGQLLSNDPLRGITFDWSIKPETDAQPIGYAAFFELLNGFEKTYYMTRDEVDAHGRKYSKAYQYDISSKKQNSPWSTNFDAMATKTVIKSLISTFGPQSTDMQQAIEYDQAVVTDKGAKYVDNDSMEDVKATEDQKAAILAANSDENVEISGITITDDEPDTTAVANTFPGAEVIPEKKETVAEKARRKYGPKQQTIADDSSDS